MTDRVAPSNDDLIVSRPECMGGRRVFRDDMCTVVMQSTIERRPDAGGIMALGIIAHRKP